MASDSLRRFTNRYHQGIKKDTVLPVVLVWWRSWEIDDKQLSSFWSVFHKLI